MKKLALILAICGSYLFIVACGNQQNEENVRDEWSHDGEDTLGSPTTGLGHDDSMRVDSLQDSLRLDNNL